MTLPAYMLLAGVCLLFIGIGWERNHLRFDGYEDQTLLVSLTDWWANKVPPENLVSRNIGEVNALTYWSTDGMTYVLATWVWSGGFSAMQLIWYALTPLFVWLVPLAHFALALQVTKREDTAAAALGMTLILALTTSNSISGGSGSLALGQEAAFQLNTLRTFSNALILPLALSAFFALLRTQERRCLVATALILLALALVHPPAPTSMFRGVFSFFSSRLHASLFILFCFYT